MVRAGYVDHVMLVHVGRAPEFLALAEAQACRGVALKAARRRS